MCSRTVRICIARAKLPARSLADSGDNAQAIETTRRILRRVPEDPEVHTFLSRYYGGSGQMFMAHLHRAYAALYANEKNRVDQFFNKAKELAQVPEEKARVERFESEYKERKEFW